ncbi:hypothetical protein ACJH6J_27445 [Mycobacterium sp. SMC-18]|uniref:hypothetical protein n=1 Tax=Mycobacterium sp. SMC-18 TaxID=3381629 RepID=UPI0038766D23
MPILVDRTKQSVFVPERIKFCRSILRQVHNSNLNYCFTNNIHTIFSGVPAQAANLILNRAGDTDGSSDSCVNCVLGAGFRNRAGCGESRNRSPAPLAIVRIIAKRRPGRQTLHYLGHVKFLK